MECHKCRLTYACRLSNIFLFLIEGIKCIILRVFFENAYTVRFLISAALNLDDLAWQSVRNGIRAEL